MNVFGAFSFGRLIKTFLPGFIILLSIPLYAEAMLLAVGSGHSLLHWTYSNAVLASVISIPLSLILGIISNIVFFAFLTERIIRKPFNENNQAFNDTQQKISEWIVSHYEAKDVIPRDIFKDFKNYIDLDFFLLPQIQLDKLIFLQESYWYYLEFQLNLILSLVLFAVSILFLYSVHVFKTGFNLWSYLFFVVLCSFVLSFLIYISLKAAKLNYEKHRKKLLSLQLGAVCLDKNEKSKKE